VHCFNNADANQFKIITELLGSPEPSVIETICNVNTVKFVKGLPQSKPVAISTKVPGATAQAIDLLVSLSIVYTLGKDFGF
jgi:hypothetical protein